MPLDRRVLYTVCLDGLCRGLADLFEERRLGKYGIINLKLIIIIGIASVALFPILVIQAQELFTAGQFKTDPVTKEHVGFKILMLKENH